MEVAILPRYVALKSNNDQLLIISPTGKTPMLEFSASPEYLFRMACVHEVFVVDKATGAVAIKYLNNGKYWQISYDNPYHQDAVMANFDGIPSASDKAALFVPIRLNKDTVALKSVSENHFCDRRAYNFLLPRADSIADNGKMVVAEPITSRTLSDVVYAVDKATVYDRRVVTLASQTATNSSSLPGQVELSLTYSLSSTESWSNSTTVGVTVKVSGKVGLPVVSEGGVEISASASHTWGWGEQKTESVQITGKYTVKDVPPGAKVRVTVSGEEAKCDVPFSYRQRDTLPDATTRSNDYVDGVYTGANVFNITWEAHDVHTKKLLSVRALALPSKK